MNKLDFKEVFDRNFLSDWDLFKTVTETFCDTVPEQLDVLKTAIASRENKRIKQAAHKLKGSVVHFHHVDPVATVKSIEEQWQNPNYSEIEASFVRLNSEISMLMAELKMICSQKSLS
ncbi:Hpt domain-containing protein [Bdellovibrio bacteriovorus]|uniref:Hpt domain-containing protein n=1 Tax=Bdellovibrio bacteriovorus TaxID=959 RepID=UPI0035A6D6E2